MFGLLLRPFLPAPATTIIIPTFNEAHHIISTIQTARAHTTASVEIIVSDAHSSDCTVSKAYEAGARVLRVRGGRAAQLNAAARCARGRTLLFLHADTRLPVAYDAEIRRVLSDDTVAGAFRLGLDSHLLAMRLVCMFANVRSSLLQRPYGDQGLFLAKSTFREVGGYPDISFLDDYEMVRRLSAIGPIRIAKTRVETSARRWQTLGVFRTTLMNQCVIAGYHLGVPVEKLGRWYRGALKSEKTVTTQRIV